MSRHWTTRFNGLPYAKGGDGPAYNCWFFFAHVEREQFGRALPEVNEPDSLVAIARAFRDRLGSSGWCEVTGRPRSGDGVLMAHFKYPSHVGVFVDDVFAGGAVLHCVEGQGSVLHSLFHLKAAHWRITGIYRPIGEA